MGTRRAILSFGRKNGKTSLAAVLLLTHLCGPIAIHNSQMYSTALSRDQAAQLFQLAAKIVRMSPILSDTVIVRDGSKELRCPEMGTSYRALSAEASTNYGLSPVFIVHDELGQVKGPRSALYDALETATGAQQDPLSIIISTQARTDADLLSVLIDDALTGHDPRVIVSLYTAPLDADPFDIATIKLANPALGQFLNPREVLAMAGDARRMPTRENEYRNLILNQRVEASHPFVNIGDWKACGAEPVDLEGREVYAGLDLSEVNDLTALLVIGNIKGVWHVKPTFWLPGIGLEDRARNDRVPYDLWASKGYLLTTPGRTISYDYVAQYLKRVLFDRHKVQRLAFDRWNMKHLRPWLLNAGFHEKQIEERFVEFGQGTQSMSPALRELEQHILDRKLAHGNHPVLSMCAINAVVEGDVRKSGRAGRNDPGKDSSNRKLSKKKSSGRIDGMVALAMAMGVAPLTPPKVDIAALIG